MMIHHYANGVLNIGSKIGATGAAPAQVTITGPSVTGASTLSNWIASTSSQVVLSADNSTAAQEMRWYLNGSVLSISNENQLGKVDIATATADSVYLNGGALRWTGSGSYNLDQERGFTIGGNGGVIDVVNADAALGVVGEIRTENNYAFINGSAANHQGGDLIKMGAGTLRLDGDYVPPTTSGGSTSGSGNNGGFAGLIDVREGTLRLTGNSTTAANGTVTTILGTSRSMHDGTILRAGASMEFAMGSSAVQNSPTGVPGHEWRFEEWFRFEGDNLINFGTPGGAEVASGNNSSLQNRLVRLDGVNEIAGNITMEVEAGMIVRFNQSSGGYLTGSGTITKAGGGDLEFRENSPEWTGGLNILQGTVRTANAGRPLGTGTLPINLGSSEHQGIAQLAMHNEQAVHQQPNEIFQNINVIYNPAQAKRITFDNPQGLGQDYYVHGNITLSDNLGLYHNRGAVYTGGQFPFAFINGQISDDIVNGRSGNISVHHDDANNGAVSNQQNSPGIGYVVLNNNNSAWTGDLVIGLNQSWDQDEFIAVRLGHAQALTAANDVTMNGSSILQAGGNNVTIGSLHTNNGSGTLAGTANDGLGAFEGTSGSSAYIENAAASPGTIAITQTTPVTTEALWDVYFRNGQLPSHFFNQSECVAAALSVSKLGGGWATMTLDNDYTGTTRVSAGILQVGKNGVGDTGATNAAGAIVENGGVIAGTGTVQGGLTVQSGGELRPGDAAGGAAGVLTVNGNLNLLGGSITTLQASSATYNNPAYVGVGQSGYNTWINGIPADSFANELTSPAFGSHDQVIVNGSITTAGATKIVLANNGYTPVAGDVFNLLDWFTSLGSLGMNVGPQIRSGTETGTNLDLFDLGGHYRWDTSLFNQHGLLVVVPNVVPEPGRLLMLMLGLFAIFGRRRRS
jgi:autotransporter-associated beta strand protein